MAGRVVSLVSSLQRVDSVPPCLTASSLVHVEMLLDSYNRQIRDLRISLTDRCNFRCFYCSPAAASAFADRSDVLTLEEISTICEIFVSLGIEKIRLTGGEPLLRKDIEILIAKLARLKYPGFARETQNGGPGDSSRRLLDLAITTNGSTFSRRANALKSAGLDRVTFSLDSLKRENFRVIAGVDRIDEVLGGIDAAKRAGFSRIKINSVIIRGRNDDEIVDLARFARQNELSVRFIEFMPLDAGHQWNRNLVVFGNEIRDRIDEVFPLVQKESTRGRKTAWRFQFADGQKGEIGIIAPVSDMFCGACSRIRLTADGQIRTCLFSTTEYDLRSLLRRRGTRAEITEFIRSAVLRKEFGHTINQPLFIPASRSMNLIGG